MKAGNVVLAAVLAWLGSIPPTVGVAQTGYPAAGFDSFPSTAEITVDIPGLGTDTIVLEGPTTVHRGDPVLPPLGGTQTIDTEILSMNLTGTSPVFGPVGVFENPNEASRGQIIQQPGQDFPAESFFDVFVILQTQSGALHNETPIRMQSRIYSIPPREQYKGFGPIPLLDEQGIQRGTITHAFHRPDPPIDCFESWVTIVVRIFDPYYPGGVQDTLELHGPTMVLRGEFVDPGDGRREISTEIVSLRLSGVSPRLGPVKIVDSPTLASSGKIKSQTPGSDFPADSFFDVFVKVHVAGETFVTKTVTRMTANPPLNQIPPPNGQVYYGPGTVIPLYDLTGTVQIGEILEVEHMVGPTSQWSLPRLPHRWIDCFQSSGSVIFELFGVGTDTVQLSGPTMVERRSPLDLGQGLQEIDTEIISLELTGTSDLLGGPVIIRQSSISPSLGKIDMISPYYDFPSQSFFDVFFDLQTPQGLLPNQGPARMQALIWDIPPTGDKYRGPHEVDIVDPQTQQVIGRMRDFIHIPKAPGNWIFASTLTIDRPDTFQFPHTDVTMRFLNIGSGGNVTVRQRSGAPTGPGVAGFAAAPELHISSVRFWDMSTTITGQFLTSITFTYDPELDGIVNEAILKLATRADSTQPWAEYTKVTRDTANNTITADSVTNFSQWIFAGDNPLPVELAVFTATVEGSKVVLTWTTASETNNLGFDIERRKNADDGKGQWQKLGFVKGHGTTATPQSYTYVDEALAPGVYEYRLKQIDAAGGFTYSAVVSAFVGLPTSYALHQNYPNPFNPETVIRYQLSAVSSQTNQPVVLKVYNLLGQAIRTLVDEKQRPGWYRVVWDGTNDAGQRVGSGVYLYRLEAGSFKQVKKMLLVR